MLLGEAPGETEIHNGIPFSGRAGKQLMVLERIHVTRKKYILRALFGVDLINGERKERNGEIIQKSIIERQIREK